ncbi:hypothetical protein DRQ53_10020 [bacterium]|nr:MAG: hypothetical protein DRQ53_10020 [bacterium]
MVTLEIIASRILSHEIMWWLRFSRRAMTMWTIMTGQQALQILTEMIVVTWQTMIFRSHLRRAKRMKTTTS